MRICVGNKQEKGIIFMENIAINKRFQDLHFDSIQALRGLAALFVVFQHVRFLNFGAFGVDIFFCISGFMIMFTTEKSTKYFFRKRLIRILPLYYLMTFGTYAMLLFFPSMFQQTRHNLSYRGIIQPLVRIGWTINCEMLFYLLFFIAFHISMKYRGLICSAFLTVLVGAVQIFAPLISSWQSPIGRLLSPVLIFLRRSCHAGIHFRNPRLLSAAFFISQAFGASVSYGCKCAVCGRHSGDFLSVGIFHPQDQCDRFPQASAVGTSGICTVGFSFSGRTEALSAPLFHPYGKYQLFPVSGALLSGNVLRPGGVRLLHPLCNVCHRSDLKCGAEYRVGLPVLDRCGAKILRMAAEETAALSISLIAPI